jgi:hypothetical protein
MTTTAVGHCEQCAAVVNRRWARCLVCHAPLIAAPTHPQVEAVTETAAPVPPQQPSEGLVIEPAAQNSRPVYFWRNDGGIHGPARVIDLEKIGTGDAERFWVIVDYQEQTIWVRSDRLRSKRAFEQQITPKLIELIREPR